MARKKRGPTSLAAIADAQRKRLADRHGIDLRTPPARPLGELVEWF